MKDYGMEYEEMSFLEKHGGMIWAASCAISTVIVVGFMIMAFILSLPGCIDQLAGHSANVVAVSRGIAE